MVNKKVSNISYFWNCSYQPSGTVHTLTIQDSDNYVYLLQIELFRTGNGYKINTPKGEYKLQAKNLFDAEKEVIDGIKNFGEMLMNIEQK